MDRNKVSEKQAKTLWRQGDLLIQECDALPKTIKRKKGRTLVHSQTSGHSHRISEKRTCRIFTSLDEKEEILGTLYVEVFAEKAELIHDEHDAIILNKGLFRVWRQREFGLHGHIRVVLD